MVSLIDVDDSFYVQSHSARYTLVASISIDEAPKQAGSPWTGSRSAENGNLSQWLLGAGLGHSTLSTKEEGVWKVPAYEHATTKRVDQICIDQSKLQKIPSSLPDGRFVLE
jgi:hypothetical protein